MKWILTLLLVGAIGAVALLVPPRTTARLAARGLRATWDWVSSLQPLSTPGTAAPGTAAPGTKKPKRSKAQAALPQGPKAGREGIVAQPPKEKLGQKDRSALEALLSRSRAP